MPGDQEVLFATIAAGGGHVATARALAESLEHESAGHYRGRVSDVMAEYGAAALDRRHKRAWRDLLARPRLVRLGQRLTDSAPSVTRALHEALLDGFARAVTTALNAERPRLIVVNHGWLATAFSLARSRYGLASPVVVFATEPFDASALWSTPAAEAVLAPSAAARSDLVDHGVPATRVAVSGYPVARRFLAAPPQAEARARLGLPEVFTCLVTLGAEGVAGEEAVSALLALARADSQVVAVCGRNQALRRRLESAAEAAWPAGSGRLKVLGFVDDMEIYLAACDVVVGKAGPASTMEALAVGRPVVTAAYAGLNELAVVRFLEAYGLGSHSGGFAGLPAAVQAWREAPERRAAAASTVATLDFGAMLRGLGRYLTARAQDPGKDATALLEPGLLASVSRARLAAGPRGPLVGSAP